MGERDDVRYICMYNENEMGFFLYLRKWHEMRVSWSSRFWSGAAG